MKQDSLLFLARLEEHKVVALDDQPERFELVHICFEKTVTLGMSIMGIAVLREEAVVIKHLQLLVGLLRSLYRARYTLHARLVLRDHSLTHNRRPIPVFALIRWSLFYRDRRTF